MTYGRDSSEPSDTPQQAKQAGSIRNKGENNYIMLSPDPKQGIYFLQLHIISPCVCAGELDTPGVIGTDDLNHLQEDEAGKNNTYTP